MNLQTGKVRITKKALCVILSIIMAFGTFITFTVGYSPLHEWLGIRNMLSAYAAEFVDTDGAVAVDEDAMLADDHTINLENKDGSNTVYLFSEPISYTDDNGNLKTKDISVEKAGYELKKEGYDFTNGQNDYRINFSKDYNKGIQAEFEGASYSIIPQSIIKVDGEEAVAEYLDENFEVFQYKNIYGNGTNLRFYPQLNGVKDEIILNQNINKNTFSFELKTENCTAQLNEDSTISLVNKEGTTIQTFAAPFAYDSEYVEGDNTNHYVDCEYILEDKNETSYIMTITVPNEWLNNANTKYPVTIDPTTSNISQAKDAGTYKKYKTQNWGSEQLCCFGYSSDYDKGRVYTQFTLPTAIKKGAIIKEAYQWERECTGRTTSTKVIAYMVKASWSETGITWENKPGYNSNYASNKRTINSNSSDNSSPYWYKFNIKSIVNQWINGGSANYGITFRSDEEDNLNKNWRAFAAKNHSTSAYRPYTKITYENDDRGPKYDVEKSPTTWTNGNVTVTIKNVQDLNHDGGTSPVAGIPTNAYSIATSSTPSYSSSKSKSFSKNCSVNTTVKDNNNNPTTKTVTITNIDKLNPNVPTKVSGNDGAWTNQNVVVKVAVSDRAKTDNDGCSGIASYSCTKSATPSSNSSDWKSVSDGATQITLPAISSYGTYYVFVKDKAGNISSYPYTKRDYENNSTHTVTYKGYQFTAYIDKTEPVIDDVNLHYDEELGHNVLTVEAHDENEGCNYCAGIAYYSVDGGNTWKNSYAESYTFSDLSNVETIDVAVKDKAGNITHYDENPQVKVPIMYQEDKYVKIINPNENLKLQYKINDGSYIDYNEPIELENDVQTTITAIISGTNKSSTKTFTYQAPATVIPYTEEQTDITIADNSASFEVSRCYNSNTNDWFFSTQSAISEIEENYVYSVQMPDSQILYFVNENNQLINEDTDYTLTIEDASYVIDCGYYSLHYNKDNGRLSCVDDKNGHGINFSYTNDKLTSVYAEEGNETREYSVTEDSNGRLLTIETPIVKNENTHETLVFDYSDDGLVQAYYAGSTLKYSRNDDIIIGEYTYEDNRIKTSNGNTVNYENGNYVSITTPADETVTNEEDIGSAATTDPVRTYFEGTETVHTETLTETIDGKTVVTITTYDESSKVASVSVTENNTLVSLTTYNYYEGTETVHTETIAETVNGKTKTTVTTNDESSRTLSIEVKENNTVISLTTYIYVGNTNNVQKETITKVNEVTVTEYTYDDNFREESTEVKENGTVVSLTQYSYFSNTEIVHTENVTETVNDKTRTTITTYDEASHIVSVSVEEGNKVTETKYNYNDAWGNLTSVVTTVKENNSFVSGSSVDYEYDALNRCIKETASVNNEETITQYRYSPVGNILWQKEGNDVTRTLYDKYSRITQQIEPQDYVAADDNIQNGVDSYTNGNVGVRYLYNETTRLLTQEINRLDVVTTYTYHPNSSVVATEAFDVYVSSYNTDGKIINSTVNGTSYATYSYDNNTGNPTQVVYGNGQSIRYQYDSNNNLWKQYHNNDSNPYVTYTYIRSNDGSLINTEEQLDIDEALFIETNEDFVIKSKSNTDSGLYYVYSNDGKVSVTDIEDKSTVLYSYCVTQNENDKIVTTTGKIKNKNYSVVSSENGIENTYDGNVLSAERLINGNTTSTSFKVNGTIELTSTLTEGNTTDTLSYDNGLSFTDTYSNTEKEQISSSSDGTNTVSYTYYDDGQLQTVSGDDYFANYTYDDRGNLTEKTVNNVTTNYSYTNDRLTAIGDIPLTYDSIGNVLTYGNKSYTWSAGRNLSSITEGTNSYTYTYNKYGYRTSKTINGVTTDFNVTEDGTVISQSDGTNTLYFEYAKDGTPLGFVCNNTQYIYITNYNADVMAIVDKSGNIIANYCYDEWGNFKKAVDSNGIEITDFNNVALINPLRYSGYYYDSETGYYYLQSRYYDPGINRFINSDALENIRFQINEVTGINGYTYCLNDPINENDSTGDFSFKTIKKFFKKTFKKIKDKISKFIKDKIGYLESGYLYISKNIISGIIDTIIYASSNAVISSIKSAGIRTSFSAMKKYIKDHPEKFAKILKNKFAKVVGKLIPDVYNFTIKNIAKIWARKVAFFIVKNEACNILADHCKPYAFISNFTSVGSIVAFVFGLLDGKPFDNYIRIEVQ